MLNDLEGNRHVYDILQKFREWWSDDVKHSFSMLSISYNPEKKTEIEKQNVWDDDNIISDKDEFVKLLTPLVEKYFGKEYFVTDYYGNPEWLSQEQYENFDLNSKLIEIHQYLQLFGYNNKKDFFINDLNRFLMLFVDYPTQFDVSPVILISVKNQAVIMLHEINTVVIALQNESIINNLREEFDKAEITYLKR